MELLEIDLDEFPINYSRCTLSIDIYRRIITELESLDVFGESDIVDFAIKFDTQRLLSHDPREAVRQFLTTTSPNQQTSPTTKN